MNAKLCIIWCILSSWQRPLMTWKTIAQASEREMYWLMKRNITTWCLIKQHSRWKTWQHIWCEALCSSFIHLNYEHILVLLQICRATKGKNQKQTQNVQWYYLWWRMQCFNELSAKMNASVNDYSFQKFVVVKYNSTTTCGAIIRKYIHVFIFSLFLNMNMYLASLQVEFHGILYKLFLYFNQM